jgi:hypothetical protein
VLPLLGTPVRRRESIDINWKMDVNEISCRNSIIWVYGLHASAGQRSTLRRKRNGGCIYHLIAVWWREKDGKLTTEHTECIEKREKE